VRQRSFTSLASIVGGLLIWEGVSRFGVDNALFLASPSQIVYAMWKLAVTGDLWRHIYISGVEFVIGYLISCVLGVAIGLLMAESDRAKRILQPWISGIYATPTIALAPLF
jgi:NitT/TauT family transport system permease protein